MQYEFTAGAEYRRRAVKEMVGAGKESEKGGPWDLGLASHNGAHFIFCNIGVAGKTGHNYGNFWSGDQLDWSGATSSRSDWPSIQKIVESGAEVHIFYRNDNGRPFTYAGLGTAVDVSNGSPVRVLWQINDHGDAANRSAGTYTEGGKQTKVVTVVERNPKARRECLDHYGPTCDVCKMTFAGKYGAIGAGFMHVHHLTPVSTLTEVSEVDPVNDLRPVCPNCHAMLHRIKPPLTIAELQAMLQ